MRLGCFVVKSGRRRRERASTGIAPPEHSRADLGLCEPMLLHLMVLPLWFERLTHHLSIQREEGGCDLVNFV